MSKHNDYAYLGDMLDYARRAHAKVAGLAVEEWDADEDVRLSVAYLVQIVGEAASHVTDATRQSLPQLPWERIVGMRHRLVHGYGTVKPEIVWEVATTALPPLIAALEQHLAT